MPIPSLHEVVLAALDLHASYDIPRFQPPAARRRLVIASGNALATGRILFHDENALFASESDYEEILERESQVDSAVVISASGTKHGPVIIEALQKRGMQPFLITCDRRSPAAALLPPSQILETRSNPEPITYNTSTYTGMILAKTRENPARIKQYLTSTIAPLIPDFSKYESFYLIIPKRFEVEREMFITKFDELFAGRLTGRCYTLEQTLHAKTVVPWEKELFISFGCDNQYFGSERLAIPVPEDAGFVTMIAIAYYVIGFIQDSKPAWFKENAEKYAQFQKKLFEEFYAPGAVAGKNC